MNAVKLIELLLRFMEKHDVSSEEISLAAASIATMRGIEPGPKSYFEDMAKAAPPDKEWKETTGAALLRMAKIRHWKWSHVENH